MTTDNDTTTDGTERIRKQCPECNLLCNFDRIAVVDAEIRCLDCAPENTEPWYVPSGTEQSR